MSPNPRDLDPKFQKATIPTNDNRETGNDTEENVEENTNPRIDHVGRVDTEVPADVDNDVSQIVFIQRFIGQDGQPAEVKHGPMPQSEWAAYEKKKGL